MLHCISFSNDFQVIKGYSKPICCEYIRFCLVVGAARILLLYSLLVVKGNPKRCSKGSGKSPLYSILQERNVAEGREK